MNGILVILFPNGQMMIKCDQFFPRTMRYVKMLDEVISLSYNPKEHRKWLIHYLENRIYIECDDKAKTKLKKNLDFMVTRYNKTAL